MSDEGEKTCPLCAEEMDLTDQQLKPCRCGYEICVWCWHHIMDMAEKDETEGRCPACRTPYDKERIVGTAANCERLVAEIHMEKKHKSQKAKVKTSESRKQLSSVRVIQRNLVYIVGLPLNLADEDLLQRKDYFNQYGKVLKVSISRTSAGTIQQFANNTCSVYITYSKEEEAVRCIQSVHGFILDGRPLRACFGTTKYCHAWLRNVACSNPDCLYLHEIGSQEDSFTKDEIISAYTRSRVQQITGFTNNLQRRSGNVLPPPADDYCNNSSPVIAKPVVKGSSNLQNSASSLRSSPPTTSSGRSGALPPAASWGARASNCSPGSGNLACSNGPTKQKAEVDGSQVHSTTISGSTQASVLPNDGGKKLLSNDETQATPTKNELVMLDIAKQNSISNSRINVSEVSSTPLVVPVVKSVSQSSCPPTADGIAAEGSVLLNSKLIINGLPCSPGADNVENFNADGKVQKLCSDMSSISIDNRLNDEHSDVIRPNGLCLDNFLSPGSRGTNWHDSEKLQEHSTSVAAITDANVDSVTASSGVCSWATQNLTSETEDDFDNQRLRDAIVVSQATMPPSSPLHLLSHLRGPLQQHVDAAGAVNYALNPPSVNRMPEEGFGTSVSGASVASNGFLDNFVNHASSQGNTCSLLSTGQVNQIGRFESGLHNVDSHPALDMGESSIISNILDLDSWDDSLTSPQNLAKLLGESDKQEVPTKLANTWKAQNSNQSRFSFARQEESRNYLFDFESSMANLGHVANNHPFSQVFVENRDPYPDRLGSGFGFPQCHIEPSDNLTSGNSTFSSSKISTSRSQISAPPGFSAPSRPPPPGFSSQERSDQTFDIKSGNHMLDASTLLSNPYQASANGNTSAVNDIEFIDPAILAVGKGRLPSGVNNLGIDMRPNFHVQSPALENESRLQLLMQRSLSPHQSLRYSDVRDNFSPPNDAYGFASRHMEQSQVSNLSPFSQFSLQQSRNTVGSNGHWDSWNEIPAANEMGIAELLRNDRLGFNKYGMTNSGDLYNRSFRM